MKMNKVVMLCCMLFVICLKSQEFDSDEYSYEPEDSGLSRPVVVQEESDEVEPINDSEVDGLDNMSLSEDQIGVQGNWLMKKKWLMEAYKINQEIQDIVLSIVEFPKNYTQDLLPVDSQLDEFYKKEGFEQASVASFFSSVSKYLQKQKNEYLQQKDIGVTSKEEVELEELLDQVLSLIKSVDQLKLDIKSINDLDRSIKDRLKKVDEFTRMAQDESKKADEMFDKIWGIIDDKKARLIFYQLKGDGLEKVRAIKKYITETLYQDFSNFLEFIKEQMEKVTSSVQELESKGVIIKDRAERIKKIKEEKFLQEQKVQKRKETAKKMGPKIWYQKAYASFVNVTAKIYNIFS